MTKPIHLENCPKLVEMDCSAMKEIFTDVLHYDVWLVSMIEENAELTEKEKALLGHARAKLWECLDGDNMKGEQSDE